jgi:hypothetical protein
MQNPAARLSDKLDLDPVKQGVCQVYNVFSMLRKSGTPMQVS